MSDIQIEAPTIPADPAAEAKKSELSSETSTEAKVSETNEPGKNGNQSKSQQKRQKYDGRSKKRQWVFNRRDDDAKRARPTAPEDRVKRRKYLMVLGYAGANYTGFVANNFR